MADLDNFFAKKDRKKSNKGKKFSTSSDNVATSQEELQKKQDKQKKERALIQSNYSSENNENKSFVKEEEWNEYQEEIKDYTTLKIQNLTTDSPHYSDSNEKDEEIEFEENEAGEMVPKRKNPGPWKVQEVEPTPPPKAPEPVVAQKFEVKKSVYVPPAHRNNFQGGPRSAPRSKTSLDVKDDDMFPTLQGNNVVKKSVAPAAARKVETPVWSKYQ